MLLELGSFGIYMYFIHMQIHAILHCSSSPQSPQIRFKNVWLFSKELALICPCSIGVLWLQRKLASRQINVTFYSWTPTLHLRCIALDITWNYVQHLKVQFYLLTVALNVRPSVFNDWFPTENLKGMVLRWRKLLDRNFHITKAELIFQLQWHYYGKQGWWNPVISWKR